MNDTNVRTKQSEPPPPLALVLHLVRDQARAAFPGAALAEFESSCVRLAETGSLAAALAYARAAPASAAAAGPTAAFALDDAVAGLAAAGGGAVAASLCRAAPGVAVRLRDSFAPWLQFILRLHDLAPDVLQALLERSEQLLGTLDLRGYQDWALTGLRHAGADADKRLRFFRLQDPAARAWLDREAAELLFPMLERRLRAYLAALWGSSPPLRSVPGGGTAPMRRVRIASGVLRVPEIFHGVPAHQAEALFRAALAHAAAHLRFTPARFQVGSLKPLQVALVSLIEDARVEQLAIRAFPGLRRLWLPFHLAAAGATTAPALIARLARALLDPDYHDDDSWVRKGATLFFGRQAEWEDQALSRSIGGLLGNDFGQMRVQFNARTYVVEPAYRDDNLGLWDFGDTPPPPDSETLIDATFMPRPEKQDEDSGSDHAEAVSLEEEAGIPVATYPEWDHLIGRERPDWTTLLAFAGRAGRASLIEDILDRHAPLVERITRLIRSARVSRPIRQRRQPEGDWLDLDACIDAATSLRRHETPDSRLYGRTVRRSRDLSTLVLLDASESTNDPAGSAGMRVLELEREAVTLLAHAMEGLGDSFALRAFCSNGRGEVRWYHLKEFAEPFAGLPRRRLSGVVGQLSTRMGAALRHAGNEIEHQRTHRRLVLVVSDGEPSDVDVADRNYLVEDARRAVLSLTHKGIDVFCIGLDGAGSGYLPRIFGRRGFACIGRVEQLPEKLPMLYLRLTA